MKSFVGMDAQLYIHDPQFPDLEPHCAMGPYATEAAAQVAHNVRSAAEYFTREGKWYFRHDGERYGPYDSQQAAAETKTILSEREEERTEPRLNTDLIAHMFGHRRTAPAERNTDDLIVALGIWEGVHIFSHGDILEQNPAVSLYPEFKDGRKCVFITFIEPIQNIMEGRPASAVLEQNCLIGFFDNDGDWIIVRVDSRRFRVATSS